MTKKEQRIAIAEACGWELVHAGWLHREKRHYQWDDPPDYIKDLNAMHEAEKGLRNFGPKGYGLWMEYEEMLGVVTDAHQHSSRRDIIAERFLSATAAQRAEAFLKTLNLWQP